MLKSYIRLFAAIVVSVLAAGCHDGLMVADEPLRGDGVPVEFAIEIADSGSTRGILSESKYEFDNGELIHLRVVYNCVPKEGTPRTDVLYTILQCSSSSYSGKRYNIKWSVLSGQPALMWPDDAVTGTFTAYYISGSSGALNSNQMEPKLLSEYRASEVPLCAEAVDVKYGEAVRLSMKRMFSFLTLTDIQEGVSDDLWFMVHDDEKFNNAFRILFDEKTKEITPEFCQIPSEEYKDDNGNQLVVVKTYNSEVLEDGADDGSAIGTSFFLEPRAYHQFSVLYPRSRTEYATYLTYTKDLAEILKGDDNPKGAFLPNGRYVFSILKSLGVIVEESPDDSWDEVTPAVDINVEKFLRAIQSGDNYFEKDEKTDEWVQILESTSDGTRLLQNVSFHNEYYDVFETNNFRPTLSNTFDGNYHYIYDMSCPLLYENYGNIINLGIRNVEANNSDKDVTPIISCEKAERYGTTIDMSYNGIIASRNLGVVDNVRVVNVNMKVYIKAVSSGEAHNVALLFGVNQGRVYDVKLAGKLKIYVENAPGEDMIPQVMIGGVAGQNTGTISGISYIDDEKVIDDDKAGMPEITIVNNCKGDNGTYWVGGIAGTNTGNLEDIFLHSVKVNARSSQGVGSYIGGMVGENQSSNSGAPTIVGCIVRGSVEAGEIKSLTNITSYSYTGGVAGALNLQSTIDNSSVSVSVTDDTTKDDAAEYGQGGAFGIIQPIPAGSGLPEGLIRILSCYGSVLKGNGYVGNFAGIVPAGYGWEHYKDNQINVKQHSGTANIGLEREN